MTAEELLESLCLVRWHTAMRTYGNDHATLVGLLTDWWIGLDSSSNWVIDSGPAFGHRARGQGRGNCDLLLGHEGNAVGVVEVEGTRFSWCVEKIGHFFRAENPVFSHLRFGIILIYPVEPSGRGTEREVAELPWDDLVQKTQRVTRAYAGRNLALLYLRKRYVREQTAEARRINDYYRCVPTTVKGAVMVDGTLVAELNDLTAHG